MSKNLLIFNSNNKYPSYKNYQKIILQKKKIIRKIPISIRFKKIYSNSQNISRENNFLNNSLIKIKRKNNLSCLLPNYYLKYPNQSRSLNNSAEKRVNYIPIYTPQKQQKKGSLNLLM